HSIMALSRRKAIIGGNPAMEKIILDDALREKLAARGTQEPLFSQSGEVCGYFVTPEDYVKMLYAVAKSEPVDMERIVEIERDFAEHGGISLSEALEVARKRISSSGQDK